MTLLSKELLSDVLKTDNFECIGYFGNIAVLRDTIRDSGWDHNIYELAHKCKEWASEINNIGMTAYSLQSYIVRGHGWNCEIHDLYHPVIVEVIKSFRSEPEAIFQACQWILDNKDKQ